MKGRQSGASGFSLRGAALASILLYAVPLPALSGDCLTIGVPAGAGATQEIMEIVQQIGKRAALCVQAVRAPANRLSGLGLDGQVLALPAPPAAETGLIALPTPIDRQEGTLYWRPDRPEPAGAEAVIGVILGQDWALHAAEARGAKPYAVRDNKQLFEMMAAGRVDGMIIPSSTFRHFRRRYPSAATYRTKSIAELRILFLLDVRRAGAAASLDAALETLQREGYVKAKFEQYTR